MPAWHLKSCSRNFTMIESRTLRAESATGESCLLTVEVAETPPYRLIVSGLEFQRREFIGDDLFEALSSLRQELELSGYQLICAGARVDVFPSGMARSMGSARKAYILPFGKPATELIDIFGDADPDSVGTVLAQKEYYR